MPDQRSRSTAGPVFYRQSETLRLLGVGYRVLMRFARESSSLFAPAISKGPKIRLYHVEQIRQMVRWMLADNDETRQDAESAWAEMRPAIHRFIPQGATPAPGSALRPVPPKPARMPGGGAAAVSREGVA